MGISTQAISTAQNENGTTKNYFFIHTSGQQNNRQNNLQSELFKNTNLISSNFNSGRRFMSTMNPYIA